MIWESQRNLTWMWYYEHARRYYETHGILNVGCNYVDADGCRLGQWLTRQRKAYRLKRSGAERKKHQPMITDREEKLLEELGVQWDLTWLGRYVSVPEIAVFYYLRRYYPDTIKLSSGDFLKCEIDVYVPSLKVGIEYDGVAWHKGKKERDERKGILCRKHGIRLIRIREKGLCSIQNCDRNYFVEANDLDELQEAVKSILEKLTGRTVLCNIRQDLSDIIAAYRNYKDRRWNRIYESLSRKFLKEHAVEIRPGDMDESGINLYNWLCKQREEYRLGYMPEEHKKKLQALKISLAPNEEAWENGISALKAYLRKTGNVQVAVGYKTDTGMALGKWLAHRREEYRMGMLDENKKRALEELGVTWNPMESDEQRKKELLEAYYCEYGTIHMPMHTLYGGVALWEWLEGKRKKYRSGKLSQEEMDYFDRYGMKWNVFEEDWDVNYRSAKAYYEQKHSLFFPGDYVSETGTNMRNWLSRQRLKYKNGKLSHKQIRQLESIGMCWDFYDFKWKNTYHILKKYYNEFGNIKMSCDCIYEGIKLGMWLSTQRQAYRGNPNYHITEERIRLLNELGMDWNEKGNRRISSV